MLPLHDLRSRWRRPTLEALLASPQHPLVAPSLIPARTKCTQVPIAAVHHHGCQRSRRRCWLPFDASPTRAKPHEPIIFSSDTQPNRLRWISDLPPAPSFSWFFFFFFVLDSYLSVKLFLSLSSVWCLFSTFVSTLVRATKVCFCIKWVQTFTLSFSNSFYFLNFRAFVSRSAGVLGGATAAWVLFDIVARSYVLVVQCPYCENLN